MKQSLFSLSLFMVFMLFAQSCDSQKANSANAQNKDVANTAAMSPLAGDFSIDELDARYEGFEKAYLAGGCFWCTEAAIDRIKGVEDVWSGYAGGKEKNPTYRQVASGATSHAEAIVVYYNPEIISYETLLDVFFVAHDPTQLNRQGPDVGPHYRSAIFPLNDEQRQQAEAKIVALNASGKFSKTIATTIEDPIQFYVAEGYHQDYYEDTSNPNQGYVQNVSRPKVEKVMKVFAEILKDEFKYQ